MFVFVDVETTGLDPEFDGLLEVGIVVTRANLSVVAQESWVLAGRPLERPLDPVVIEMHCKNGLWEDVSRSELSGLDAERAAAAFIQKHDATQRPMAGSTVHFDRAFLRRNMPKLEALFHYRNIDVSTLKNLFDVWAPEIAEGRPCGKKLHRALPDLEDTIAELRYYRRHMALLGDAR